MSAAPPDPAALAIALAEYAQVKAEQLARIGFRDNLVYATIIAVAGTLTVAHSAHRRAYLLLVPAVAAVLGWTYLRDPRLESRE